MKTDYLKTAKFLSILTVSWLLGAPAVADDLKIELVAHRVVVAADGKETKVAAESAAPGETIEYTAEYQNTTTVLLRNLRPEVPIPVGLTYVPGSVRPAATQARLENGSVVPYPPVDAEGRPLPAAQVRALIWTISDLPAAAKSTLSVRAIVNR